MFRTIMTVVVFVLLSANALAKECPRYVDRAIVLAIDSSGSVKAPVWDLQIAGYVATFKNSEIASNLIGVSAIYMFAWSGPELHQELIPWFCIDDAASSRALADRIAALRRPFAGLTYIGEAVGYGVAVLNAVPFKAETKIIDISSDGQDGQHRQFDEFSTALNAAREKARANDITVNGLPITYGSTVLAKYYIRNVIVGKHAFIEQIAYDKNTKPPAKLGAFIEAMTKKLGRELNIAVK